MKIPIVWLLVASCTWICAPCILPAQQAASPTKVGEGCDLRVFGEKDTVKFLAFDSDLRKAIETRDIGRLALLILFPLRISDGRGDYYIHDIRALEGHFDQVFPPAFRKQLLATSRDGIECTYAGIRYGDEPLVWVDAIDRGYFLAGVNHFDTGQAEWDASVRANLGCSDKDWRILIDHKVGKQLRYRAWKSEHSLYAAPDVEIAGGEESVEGTGPCAHRVWAFHQGTLDVQLEEPGCYGDNDGPPSGAQAHLSVKTGENSAEKTSWCF